MGSTRKEDAPTSNVEAKIDAEKNNEAQSPPPVRKFHHYTVCLVPPESNRKVWDVVSAARADLRDPGLFRWPPHANLLYPFVDIRPTNSTDPVDLDVIERLSAACRQMEPFPCRLDSFGAFGGARRGVLWLYPDSRSEDCSSEPVVQLQLLLEEQFPVCTDQRKTGEYNPHMTLSHFTSLAEALAAQERLEEKWPTDLGFVVDAIYLLARRGDDGQFLRVADLELGAAGKACVHPSPIPFTLMPETEADWVREERMKLKERRNGNRRRGEGRQRRRRSRTRRTPDTPEEIAAKRAAGRLIKLRPVAGSGKFLFNNTSCLRRFGFLPPLLQLA
jgi:2'-5' RNA ligase